MADWEDDLDGIGSDGYTTAQAMASEMVKIAGVRFEKGEWSWTPENVATYFEEEPIWATIDAITLAAPMLKWGKAAAVVAKGSTAPGAAYKAGAVGFREAVALQHANPLPTTPVGRFISNPSGRQKFTPEYEKLIDEFGASPAEVMARADVAKREFVAEQGYWRARQGEVVSSLLKAGIPESEHETFVRAMEGAFDPHNAKLRGSVEKLMEPTALESYEKTWDFRTELGLRAFDAELLTAEHLTNQTQWMPHMRRLELQDSLKRAGYKFGEVTEEASYASFQRREYATAEFEALNDRDFSPINAAIRMGQSAQGIARVEYAKTLRESAVVRNADELVNYFTNPQSGGLLDNPRLRKMWGLSDETAASIKADLDAVPRHADGSYVEEAFSPIAAKAGWVRLSEVAPGLKLPPSLAGNYVDKKVAKDLVGTLEMTSKANNLFTKVYDDTMAFFRASKTAYNPATHVRNMFGALVFHHLAVGGMGALDRKGLSAGWKLFNEGMDNPLYRRAVEVGTANSTFDVELRSAWREAFGDTGQRATALDFLGSSRLAKAAQKLGGGFERAYRGYDEITRLDAFARLHGQFKNAHGARWSGEELEQRAVEFAALEVNRYIPGFAMHSPLSNAIRRHIPFASFSQEAVRVWSNTMQNKPHLAYFWSHMTDSMGQAFGAMAGFSQEEVAQAKSGLPYYQEGKKMLMWPFRIDGKPAFVDMSYLIPMANIVEAQREEQTFLGVAGMNPTANPFVNAATAYFTGEDPFRKLPLEPKITERQFGLPVTNPTARKAIGLVEHVAATMLPPLVPPGYAGINGIEWFREQKHQITGEKLEDGFGRTFASNVLGVRLHEADLDASMKNVANQERKVNDRVADWWGRWQWATANDDPSYAEKAEANLVELRMQRGDTREEAEAYVAQGMEQRAPGEYKGYSKGQIEKALERAKGLGLNSESDKRQMNALNNRLRHGRRKRRSRRRTRRSAR